MNFGGRGGGGGGGGSLDFNVPSTALGHIRTRMEGGWGAGVAWLWESHVSIAPSRLGAARFAHPIPFPFKFDWRSVTIRPPVSSGVQRDELITAFHRFKEGQTARGSRRETHTAGRLNQAHVHNNRCQFLHLILGTLGFRWPFREMPCFDDLGLCTFPLPRSSSSPPPPPPLLL